MAAIEGHTDGLSGFDIVGWAWRADAPDTPLTIEFLVDGRSIATTLADRHRGDLESAGKRGGKCAFRISIGRLGLKGAEARVQVRTGGVDLGGPIELNSGLVSTAEIYAARFAPTEDPTTDPSELSNGPAPVFPLRFNGPAGIEGWIEQFDDTCIRGWAYNPRAQETPVTLAIVHAGREIGRIEAGVWREDLAGFRQGDGRAGYNVPPPIRLLDGQKRALDIKLGADGPSVLAEPIHIAVPATNKWPPKTDAPKTRKKPLLPRPVQMSFIVLFYNMRREAARTLTSLTRAYQRNVDDIEYEVICIDNGSKVPLEQDWIESFGPEFKLFRPSKLLPSPCFALNEAAKAAKGKRIALMIDGAHVVTPGVLREAMDAFTETPNSVVGLRQWFFGGDQRFFSSVGYRREAEDITFAKIGWPQDGYRLFEVSNPMMPTPNPWFDSAAESNCLMLPADVFQKIGGYDETFDVPGGSLANLDLFSRAVETVGGTATMLIGEASFHQFHGGTTTNIDEDAKNAEVRRYFNDFSLKRGQRLKHLNADRIRFRGHMPTAEASVTRQRPVIRSFLGVTSQIRPTDAYLYFDDGAKDYLNGYAVEARVPEMTRWQGQSTGVAAGDLINLQEIIGAVRPSHIIAVNAHPGLALYLASMFRLLDLPESHLILVGDSAPETIAANVTRLPGPAMSGDTLSGIREAVGLAENVLVVFRPDDDDLVPVDSLRTYMSFVSTLSYMVVTGTSEGQPWLGYSTRWTRKAIQLLTGPGSDFRIDPSWEYHLVTACPWGYLRRTSGRQDQDDGVYNAALDDLSTV